MSLEIDVDSYGDELWFGGTDQGLITIDNKWSAGGCRERNPDQWAALLKQAQLFSAAPDLLEALQNLENDNGQIPGHAWKLVQDAIAKATIIQ